MTSRDFCYWLQGYFEIGAMEYGLSLTPMQTDCIKKHLAMVFRHEIDPSFGKDLPDLTKIHHPQPPASGQGQVSPAYDVKSVLLNC